MIKADSGSKCYKKWAGRRTKGSAKMTVDQSPVSRCLKEKRALVLAWRRYGAYSLSFHNMRILLQKSYTRTLTLQVTDSAGALGWNSTAKSFNEVLKLLNESYGKPKKEKKVKKIKIPILTAGMK